MKKTGMKKLKTSKSFVDYLQTFDDVYENLEDIIQQRVKEYQLRSMM